MKKFWEYVEEKSESVFSNVGMEQGDMKSAMTALRRLLGSKGVIQNGDDSAAASIIIRKLRSPIQQLVSMGLGPDDVLLAVQQVVNLTMGQKSNPRLSMPYVARKVSGSFDA